MARVSAKVLKTVVPFLKPGEEIQSAFYAAETPKTNLALRALFDAMPRFDRLIVATNLRFIVCETSWDGFEANPMRDVDRTTLIEVDANLLGDWTTSFGAMMALWWQNRSEVKKANQLRPFTGYQK